jgi:hypothetical protein
MPLNASGAISIGGSTTGQSVNLELNLAATYTSSLNDSAFRTLAEIPSGAISLSSFYGKSNLQLSYVTYATTTSQTLTIPASAQIGDIAVYVNRATSTLITPSAVIPSGWTTVSNLAAATYTRSIIAYKILASGEPGSNITVINTTYNTSIMFIFRPNTTISSLSYASLNNQIVNTDPTAQTVTAQTKPYIVIGACGSTATCTFTNAWYTATQIINASSSYVRFGYLIFNDSPSNVTVDMTDYGNRNALQSFALVPVL